MTPGEVAWGWYEQLAVLTEDAAIVERIQAGPGVMAAAVLDRAFAGGAPPRAAQIVATLRNRYDRAPQTYPIGPGPLEQLALRVRGNEISLETAVGLAAKPEVCAHASITYVNAVAGLCTARVQSERDTTLSLMLGALLVGAADALAAAEPADEEALRGRWYAWLSRVAVVKVEVHATADGALLATATEGAERLLAARIPSAELHGDLLYRLGTLWMDPWIVSRRHANYPGAIREWRMLAAARALGEQPVLVPDAAEAFPRAEDYLRRALAIAPRENQGPTLKALVQLQNFRLHILGEKIDVDEMVALARDALPLVNDPRNPEPREFLTSVLARHGGGADAPSGSWEDPAVPLPNRCDVAVMEITRLLDDPAAAVALVGRTAALFASAGEDLRAEWMRLGLIAFGALHDQGGADADDAAFAAVCAHAIAAQRSNDELAVLAELDALADQPAALLHPELIAYVRLNTEVGAASNAAGANDWATAVRHYERALAAALLLALPNQAAQLVHRIGLAATDSGDGMIGLLALIALGPRLPELERVTGERSVVVTWELAQQTMAKLTAEKVNADAQLMAHQLAKGVRFGIAAASGARFDVHADARAAALLERAEGAGAIDAPPQDDLSDEWLMAAYARPGVQVQGDARAAVAANLRLAFDAAVRAGWAAGELPPSHSLEALQALLPPDTCLVSLYTGNASDGALALWALGITRTRVVPTIATTSFPARLVEISSNDGAWDAQLGPLALLVSSAREAIRASPPRLPLDEEGRTALAQLAGMFQGLQLVLDTCATDGARRLLIAPHGALHFFPFAALGETDAPLATRWQVAYLPSLLCLSRPAPPLRDRSVCSIGLDYLSPATNPHGMPPLPAGRVEAEECAAPFGTSAFLGDDATPERFLEGLRTARYVHFSGHGALDVVAPAFQTLFFAPGEGGDGRLFAHELLRDSFAGCELVSLSACESGLGRFDLGDNLMGIPAALLAGGVKYVVATLWSVSAAAARLFFRTMYDHLHRERPCADAFAAAQETTRAAYPAFRDWAAFVIIGC